MPRKNKAEKRSSVFKSFRRTYREEYVDDFQPPRLFTHAVKTFKIIFKNWKLFGGLLLVSIIFGALFVGLMSQKNVASIREAVDSGELGEFATAVVVLVATVGSGGISQTLSDSQWLILSFLFVTIWLTTVYILRQILAKKRVTLRKSLYNAFTPLVSSFLIFLTILVEMIPIFLLIIFYSAALKTEFLNTPFYALVFLVFAILLIVLSLYLLSSSIIALAAVSAPGLYPMVALRSAHDLMFRRRTQFIIRVLFLAFVVCLNYLIVMIPVIVLDNIFKSSFEWLAEIPIISFFLFMMTCFNFIYISAYIYLYYKEMLNNEQTRS